MSGVSPGDAGLSLAPLDERADGDEELRHREAARAQGGVERGAVFGEALDAAIRVRGEHGVDEPEQVFALARARRVEAQRPPAPRTQAHRRHQRAALERAVEARARLREEHVEPRLARQAEDCAVERNERVAIRGAERAKRFTRREIARDRARRRVAREQRERLPRVESEHPHERRRVVGRVHDEAAHPALLERPHHARVQRAEDALAAKRRRDDGHVEVTDVAEVVRRVERRDLAPDARDERHRARLRVRQLEVRAQERPLLGFEEAIDRVEVAREVERREVGARREEPAAAEEHRRGLERELHRRAQGAARDAQGNAHGALPAFCPT